MNKLEEKVFIQGEIEVQTGLHIGGSSVGLTIGGADKIVVRNSLTNEPYIPGSSLKGKMRSLVEKVLIPDNMVPDKDGKTNACKCGKCVVCRLFGFAPETKNLPNQTRLIVRDCPLTKESAEQLEQAPETDMPMTEVKTEVSIDRITSVANPRNFERVPAGARFKLEMVLNIFEKDDEKELLNTLMTGMKLVQDDYIGGQGTRGYGRISIKVDELKFKDLEVYEGDNEAKVYPVPKGVSITSLQGR